MAIARRFARRGPRLSTPGGATVTFPHAIESMLTFGRMAVVLLDPAQEDRNVYGIDRRGRTVWQLQKSPFTGREASDPYVELFRLGRDVRVFSWRGQIYDVDPRTGKVLGSYWSK